MTRTEKVATTVIVAATVAIIACFLVLGMQRPAKYKMAFNATLNNYLSSHQACLWQESIQLPARVDADDEAQIARFDALVDAGQLDRAPAAPARHGKRAVKTVEYSLSTWAARIGPPIRVAAGLGKLASGLAGRSVDHCRRLGDSLAGVPGRI